MLAGVLAGVLAGCGASPRVATYDVPAGQRRACSRLVGDLPSRVAGASRADVQGSPYAAAWRRHGDAAVLRCGVGRPAGFTRTSPCDTVNGLDWFVPLTQVSDQSAAVVATTVHRRPAVEVRIPASWRPEGPLEVRADLTRLLRRDTSARGHCE